MKRYVISRTTIYGISTVDDCIFAQNKAEAKTHVKWLEARKMYPYDYIYLDEYTPPESYSWNYIINQKLNGVTV